MRPISAEARAALTSSHVILKQMEIYLGGNLVASTSSPDQPFILTGGTTQVDRKSSIRRNFNVTIAALRPDEVIPGLGGTGVYDPLFAPEIRLYRGIDLGIRQEMWPIGRYVLESSDPAHEEDGGVVISMSGRDISLRIATNVFTEPFVIAAGMTYPAAIRSIINSRATGFIPEFNFANDTTSTPDITLAEGTDPWEEAINLAKAIGMELYVDAAGVFVLRPVPDPLTSPVVWEYTESSRTRMNNTQRSVNTNGFYNGVVVRGSAPWLLFPVRGEAWDDDPNSPSYYLGDFGKRPKTIDDASVTSEAQAITAAKAELKNTLGSVEEARVDTIVNPALEGGDIVLLRDLAVGVDDRVVLESFPVPLMAADTQSITVRRQRRSA